VIDFLGHIFRMTRFLSLFFLSLADSWFTEVEIQDILADEVAKELREFLKKNYVTLKPIKLWLRAEARISVGPLARKTFEIGTSQNLDSSFRERGKIRRLLNALNEIPPNEKGVTRPTLLQLVELIGPDARCIHVEMVEGFFGVEKISQALTASVSNDKKCPLPVYESLDVAEAGEPPAYSTVPNPPSYEILFSEQFIESESRLIHDVISFCREANLEEVAPLTNALVSLMFSNWKVNLAESFPADYKRGSAAEVARLARQLKQTLALPSAN